MTSDITHDLDSYIGSDTFNENFNPPSLLLLPNLVQHSTPYVSTTQSSAKQFKPELSVLTTNNYSGDDFEEELELKVKHKYNFKMNTHGHRDIIKEEEEYSDDDDDDDDEPENLADEEDLEDYVPGGYHPCYIGENYKMVNILWLENSDGVIFQLYG